MCRCPARTVGVACRPEQPVAKFPPPSDAPAALTGLSGLSAAFGLHSKPGPTRTGQSKIRTGGD